RPWADDRTYVHKCPSGTNDRVCFRLNVLWERAGNLRSHGVFAHTVRDKENAPSFCTFRQRIMSSRVERRFGRDALEMTWRCGHEPRLIQTLPRSVDIPHLPPAIV